MKSRWSKYKLNDFFEIANYIGVSLFFDKDLIYIKSLQQTQLSNFLKCFKKKQFLL